MHKKYSWEFDTWHISWEFDAWHISWEFDAWHVSWEFDAWHVSWEFETRVFGDCIVPGKFPKKTSNLPTPCRAEKRGLTRSDSCIFQIVNNKSKLLDLARCYCLEKKFGGRWLFCPTPPYNGW